MDRVRYFGEAVAAVAAVTIDIAEKAIELIEVEYEPLKAAGCRGSCKTQFHIDS